MLRTMARVTDVHVLEEDNDGVELPKVNEDLRNFFLPRKQVAPEPEPAPEAKTVDASDAVTPTFPSEDASSQELKALKQGAKTLPGAAKHAERQAPQPRSPSSAYRPGAFDAKTGPARTPEAPRTSRGWFSFSRPSSKSGSRLSKEASRFSLSTNLLAAQDSLPVRDGGAPLRFSSKHAMAQALSAPLPLPATNAPEGAAPDEAQGAEAAAGQLGQEAVTEVPPLPAEEVAASIGAAVSGDPVCEAVMAAQELSQLVLPGPAVVGEEAAAPLRPTEEPEQDAPVPEAPQPEPEPTEEAVAATSTDQHAGDARSAIKEAPAATEVVGQEEHQSSQGGVVAPAEAGSHHTAEADPEQDRSSATLNSDAAEAAAILEEAASGATPAAAFADFYGPATAAAPAGEEDRDNSAAASDAAAPKAAPAAAGAEKEDAALPAGEADKEDAALPAAEPEREDAAPPAAEPEREGALCASPPSSPAHEVPISSFYQKGGRKSPPKKKQPKEGGSKWGKWFSKKT